MANIMDYIDWRGDISLKISPFNDVDSLILSQLSMLDLEGIVPAPQSGRNITLREAAELFFEDKNRSETPLGFMIPHEIVDIFGKMGKSERFGKMRLAGYVSLTDVSVEQQFAAVSVILGDGSFFVSYRGTDDSLIGWKEDLNLSFMYPIPSQLEAVSYLDRIGKGIRGKIRIGGHSKGGNLAVFAAVKCNKSIRKRIIGVYNNDGPGFSREFLSLPEYAELDGRIRTVVPQSSVVGMLFENDEKYTVVKSTESGLMQHNAFSWEVLGCELVAMEALTSESRELSKRMNGWMRNLDMDARRRFVDAIYSILISTNATTVTELYRDRYAILRSLKNTDKETRQLVFKSFKVLFGEDGKRVMGSIMTALLRSKKRDKDKKDKSEK